MNNSWYEPIRNGVRRPVVLRGLTWYLLVEGTIGLNHNFRMFKEGKTFLNLTVINFDQFYIKFPFYLSITHAWGKGQNNFWGVNAPCNTAIPIDRIIQVTLSFTTISTVDEHWKITADWAKYKNNKNIKHLHQWLFTLSLSVRQVTGDPWWHHAQPFSTHSCWGQFP